MSHSFRYHTGPEMKGWGASSKYDKKAIENVHNPDLGNPDRAITSIPSPFARIDLVKTAFNYVVQQGTLEGDSYYHRLVSEALDVGEMLFYWDQLNTVLSLHSWEVASRLQHLRDSATDRHTVLADTLELFLKQDAGTYHFDEQKRFYIITHQGVALGGVSPATLFFSAETTGHAFDVRLSKHAYLKEIVPLHERESEYIGYLFYLAESLPRFGEKFKEVKDYLDMVRRALQNKVPTFEFGNYPPLNVASDQDPVDVLGFSLRVPS